MDALELLTQDHNEVRQLFEEFRSAAEQEDTSKMGDLTETIFQKLTVHTAIEEDIFYPAVRDANGKELSETTDESYEEHHVVDLLMGEIRQLRPGEDAFKAKMTVLMENVEHHAQEEEEEMFTEVREIMSEERLQQLGEELQKAMTRHLMGESSKEELMEKAQAMGIEGRSSMSKEELIEAIERTSAS